MRRFLLTINIAIVVCGGFWLTEAKILNDLPTLMIISLVIGWSLSSLTTEISNRKP